MLEQLKEDKRLPRLLAIGLALVFTAIFLYLNTRQYLTFSLQAPDIDRFDQALWNTLRGRFLFSSIPNKSILAYHFSPYMALLSPLLLIWSDVRILFAAQIVGIAATGLILFKMIEDKRPWLALILLVAFYLNASLQQVTLLEFRRVTLAMPFIALAIYGLYKDRRWLMLLGIILALLVKEDLGLLVAAMGVYLLVVKRDWKWGIPITLLGLVWTVAMVAWVLPAIRGGFYDQIGYFSDWGSSPQEIAGNILSQPGMALRAMFDSEGTAALWRMLLPLGLLLPFLAPEIMLMSAPLLGLYLLSSEPEMHRLERWYLAPLLPIFFAALAVALLRIPRRYAGWAAAGLLLATAIGYILYSPGPLGGRFEPYRYQMTERHVRAWQVLDAVPDEARVATQVDFIVPLAHREHIYLYPWYAIGRENIEYFVMGRDFDSYPIHSSELDWEINNLVVDPELIVDMEVDGIYLLRQGGVQNPAFEMGRTADDAIRLDRVEVAVADEEGVYQTATEAPLMVSPGQELRVTLYWEALAAPEVERTVSVRVEDAAGALVAQYDSQPVQASRPTSWWQPGWRLRDVYYLTVAPEAAQGAASLDLVLYDSYTGERAPFDGGDETLQLLPLELVADSPS
ncbi:MAG TPA: DUF2079 domain-containing protein [Anaerolineae bacterium]|jgi:uncharacterized membrane protein|nr:DUF2079 domain-containing protein [Anaerolineae bacterium]